MEKDLSRETNIYATDELFACLYAIPYLSCAGITP
jgi:hypothetical protein